MPAIADRGITLLKDQGSLVTNVPLDVTIVKIEAHNEVKLVSSSNDVIGGI